MNVAASKIREWRENPRVFVREVFGVIPDAWQDDVLEAFPHNPRLAMKASKGVGKTALLSWLCWNFLLTRPKPKIAATAISGDNLRDNLWSEMAFWLQKSPLLSEAFEWQAERIVNKDAPETWWMSARKWSQSANAEQQGNTLAGLHSDYVMIVLDESGGIPDSVMANAEGIGSSAKEWHIVQAGNPTHLSGPLYRACTNERSLWHVVEITADPDDPKRTSRVSVEWARDQIMKYGKDSPWVLVNVFGRFPPASMNSLIGPDEVREAMERDIPDALYQAEPRIIGVDVARFGDDSSVLAFRHGPKAFKFVQVRNYDNLQGAGLVARYWQDWQADAAMVDSTGGFGSGWIDNLKAMSYKPVGVEFAGQAHNKQKYHNKRTEMYFDLCEWIKAGGCLPNDPDLIGELTVPQYTFHKDRLLLEPKEIIKVNLGRSPDKSDALACTFAEPVRNQPMRDAFKSANRQRYAEM